MTTIQESHTGFFNARPAENTGTQAGEVYSMAPAGLLSRAVRHGIH
jgi:hypothetical protein